MEAVSAADRLRELVQQATPGPWEPRAQFPHDVLTAWEENGGRLVIFCEHAGDARLIARAPDLAAWAADAADIIWDMGPGLGSDVAALLARLDRIMEGKP